MGGYSNHNFFLFTSSILLCLADRRFPFSWIFFIRNWIHWSTCRFFWRNYSPILIQINWRYEKRMNRRDEDWRDEKKSLYSISFSSFLLSYLNKWWKKNMPRPRWEYPDRSWEPHTAPKQQMKRIGFEQAPKTANIYNWNDIAQLDCNKDHLISPFWLRYFDWTTRQRENVSNEK